MDRLTKEFKPGWFGLVKVKENEQEVDSPYPNTLRAILESFKRLGEYEDTGLTPEQVAELQTDRDAWKRRAEAAEKDLELVAKLLMEHQKAQMCEVCLGKYDPNECAHHCSWSLNSAFKWRGPRDEGKEVSQ